MAIAQIKNMQKLEKSGLMNVSVIFISQSQCIQIQIHQLHTSHSFFAQV